MQELGGLDVRRRADNARYSGDGYSALGYEAACDLEDDKAEVSYWVRWQHEEAYEDVNEILSRFNREIGNELLSKRIRKLVQE